jgi:predicted acyltransferase
MLSIDVFRGIAIIGMILVNNPGSWTDNYWLIRHAKWNGCTPADLIFPAFLFIVGVAITLSLTDRRAQGANRRQIHRQIVRRTVILCVLGVFLSNFPHFEIETLRIPGVLQRIGICYFCSALITLRTATSGRAVIVTTLLASYWLLMKLVPVPGHGAGVLTPEGNLAAYIDHLLLPGHTYQTTWDPEGLLSTIPAVATTLLGVLAGDWLRASHAARERLLGLVAAGAAGVVLGMIMSIWFPINKSLWTSSYVVFTGGVALLVLALCYEIIDLRQRRGWITPFVIFGSNPIAVYVLSTMVGQMMEDFQVTQPGGAAITLRSYLLDTLFTPWAGESGGSLLFAIAYVLAWLPPMAVLYRRRIFIKI